MKVYEIVKQGLEKAFDEQKVLDLLKRIHFCYGDGNYESGIYVYEEYPNYIYVDVGDRGGIQEKIETADLQIILDKLYRYLSYCIATDYAIKNRRKNVDFRRLLFEKQLELLKKINEITYLKVQNEIDAILKKRPYVDNLE